LESQCHAIELSQKHIEPNPSELADIRKGSRRINPNRLKPAYCLMGECEFSSKSFFKDVPMKKIVLFIVVLMLGLVVVNADSLRNFVSHLAGRNEVPAAIDTNAQGQVILHVKGNDSALTYKLIASNIDGVTQAHIHCGPEGVNAAGTSSNGVLSQGTNANIIARPSSAACPGGVANLADLLAKIRSGGAYVNVHTLVYPGGEIRGQIQ
jgi:hypothetical protein